jgi:amidase
MPPESDSSLGLESYFRNLATNPRGIYTMAGLVNSMMATPVESVLTYGIDGFVKARDEPLDGSSSEFQAALHPMARQGSAIARMLDHANCDALVMPTMADIPSDLGHNPVIAFRLVSSQRRARRPKATR